MAGSREQRVLILALSHSSFINSWESRLLCFPMILLHERLWYEMKRIGMLLLSLVFLLSTSACSNDTINQSAQIDLSEKDNQYHIEYLDMPSNVSISTVQIPYNDGIYIAGKGYDGNLIHGILKDNQFIPFSLPAENGEIIAACYADENIAVLFLNDDKEWSTVQLQEYNNQGSLVMTVPIKDFSFTSNKSEVSSIQYQDNYFYLLSPDLFLQVSSDGLISNSIDLTCEDNLPGQFISQCRIGGSIALCVYGYGVDGDIIQTGIGAEIYVLNSDSFSLELVFSNETSWPLGLGEDTEGSVLLIDENGLHKIDCRTKNSEDITNWKDANIHIVSYDSIFPMSSSKYLMCKKDATELHILSNEQLNDARTELVLLCDQPSLSLNYLIERFNISNKDYFITLQYNEGNEELSKVKTIAGESPDIYFFCGNTPLNPSLQKNVFENLYPFFDNDPEYSRDSILPSLCHLIDNQGCLYILPFDYMIWTFITTVDVDDVEAYSMDQFVRFMEEQYPDRQLFQTNYSRSDMWYWVSNLCVGSFINEDSATCYFNTPEYAELLKSIKNIPVTVNDSDFDCLFKVDQIGNILRIYGFEAGYHDQYSFVGCPTGGFSNGTAFDLQKSFAISKSSSYKEGAWQFLRSILAPSVINNSSVSGDICLPASTLQLSSIVRQARGPGYNAFGMQIKISEHGEQELYKIINNGNTVMNGYPEIVSIMQEEASKYFSGEKTLEDVTTATQSRVSIFMAEQYG